MGVAAAQRNRDAPAVSGLMPGSTATPLTGDRDLPRGTAATARGAGANRALKRGLDLVVAAGLLVGTFPIFVLAALAVKLADGGPVLFWQRRVGLGYREFWLPKLRSMRLNAEQLHEALQEDHGDPASVTFKLENDPRVTRVGRLLRTLSIDELPQLWCVLRGEMSMVGPRPPLPGEVARYSAQEHRRLRALPGLTCLWQVSGRSSLPFDRQVALDLEYVDKQSLRLDLKLLLRTIPAVLSCRGAY